VDLIAADLGDEDDTFSGMIYALPVGVTGGSDDTIDGGPGPELLDDGGGDETLQARDGAVDQVSCGTGTDTAAWSKRATRSRLTARPCSGPRRPRPPLPPRVRRRRRGRDGGRGAGAAVGAQPQRRRRGLLDIAARSGIAYAVIRRAAERLEQAELLAPSQ
jgi:hypothetical protein